MEAEMLRLVDASEVTELARRPVDPATLQRAAEIVEDVRAGGEPRLRAIAQDLGDLPANAPMILGREVLEAALAGLAREARELLQRTAARIESFAAAQREALRTMDIDIPGGRAGHEVAPVQRAGCYAPGGNFPLPSSVLMTAVTARAAGVEEVWIASPRPAPITLAAAAVAGADGFLTVGGAQAIAALAYGIGLPAVDVIVGPGNRWVTAAKKHVFGDVGIDMLAGPSELVVLADDSADPARIAADLIGQAEHDVDALPILVTTDETLPRRVRAELERRLNDLPTRAIATQSLCRGFAVVVSDLNEAGSICDRLAPEHLQLDLRDPQAARGQLKHYGALFLGPRSAEVFGDYGAGPNHVLPTGGGARFSGGLSVLDFLRVRTWLEVEDSSALAEDAAALARLEGLEGHARAAEIR